MTSSRACGRIGSNRKGGAGDKCYLAAQKAIMRGKKVKSITELQQTKLQFLLDGFNAHASSKQDSKKFVLTKRLSDRLKEVIKVMASMSNSKTGKIFPRSTKKQGLDSQLRSGASGKKPPTFTPKCCCLPLCLPPWMRKIPTSLRLFTLFALFTSFISFAYSYLHLQGMCGLVAGR